MRMPAGLAVLAGWMFAAAAAHAQGPGPYYGPPTSPQTRADLDSYEPYGTMPPGALRRGDGASLLPPYEAYQVLRESGFSPIGVPRLRGYTYVITAIDRRGDYGRLLLDARTGEVITFTPAYRMGENYEADLGPYGPRSAPPPPAPPQAVNVPRPPAPVPRVASRTVPMPVPRAAPADPAMAGAPPQPAAAAPKPPAAATAAIAPPSAQPAAAAPKPAPAPAVAAAPAPPAAPANTVGEAKPAPQVLPTQPMPQAQGLEY
jgi:hypothetical protein